MIMQYVQSVQKIPTCSASKCVRDALNVEIRGTAYAIRNLINFAHYEMREHESLYCIRASWRIFSLRICS
jgi:hypothetical protein